MKDYIYYNLIFSALILGFTLISNRCLAQEKPNIVFIFIDDLGWKDVGNMGSQYYETPNIDRLAKQGYRIVQHRQ